MCLIAVVERRATPKPTLRKGYKIFRVARNGKLQFLFQSHRLRLGEWMKASCRQIEAEDGRCYRSGFHVYTSLKAAQERCRYLPAGRNMIVKVLVRGVRTIGLEPGRVMVADEMFVPVEYADCRWKTT